MMDFDFSVSGAARCRTNFVFNRRELDGYDIFEMLKKNRAYKKSEKRFVWDGINASFLEFES